MTHPVSKRTATKARVLVVDDEPAILTTLKKALSLEGYAVDVAGGVALAKERFAKQSYDVALLDVALPDGNGVDLLESLRSGGSDAVVVMMSGHASIDVAVRATRLGALDFLEKPLSTDRLLLVLENALRLRRAEQEAAELKEAAGYFDELLGESAAMRTLRERVSRAARSPASVLVTGERGTGKELVARAIHRGSPRAAGPMEKLNCAAVPANLIESELFGHEAGAFTGATKQRRGKFERASSGTLFLDEVGDMPLDMQAKLLRVLQESEIERVGGNETIRVDVRVVAATNKDLVEACKQGQFRPDLYDRLNVVPLTLPALRARREDIPELSKHFLAQAVERNGRPGVRFEPGALEALTAHAFPGNVRELKNLVERLVILGPDDAIRAEDVVQAVGAGAAPAQGLYRPGVPFRVLVEEAERTILDEALSAHGGQMAATARELGLERSHLYKKAKSLGLRRAQGDGEGAEDD
jgi:DNA-binding NtrC family response regulator